VNVSGVTVGSANPLPSLPALPTPALLPIPLLTADQVALGLPELSDPAIQAAVHLPESQPAIESAIHIAVEAIAAHDFPRALHAIAELLTKAPDSETRILQEPSLAPIHSGIRELVNNLAVEARTEAHKILASAAPLIAVQTTQDNSAAVLAFAYQLFETGQYANYVRAGRLGKLLLGRSQPEGAIENRTEKQVSRAARKLGLVWRRAPMLVLLVTWLLLGIFVAPFSTESWVVGFLALIVFQLVVTLRNWPGRR
jgi:hypothetical protein